MSLRKKKEAALLFGVGAAAVQMGIIYFQINPESRYGWIVPALTLAAAVLTKKNVFSIDTIREAGLNPIAVKEDADDPRITRNTEGETHPPPEAV